MTTRLIILNTCWLALVVWAAFMGYVGFVFTHDISGLSYVISALLVVAVGAVTWFGNKRQAIAFVLIALATAPATALPLGHAAPWSPPPGHYAVLGARIDVDEAIWVLLDTEAGPRFYRLPYTTGTANSLQSAMDMAVGSGGKVGAVVGEDGSPGFAEEGGGQSEAPKQAETPLLQLAP